MLLRTLRSFVNKFTGSLNRSDYSTESRQHMENYDAVAARYDVDIQSDGGHDFPPNYVRPVDEGRPRK